MYARIFPTRGFRVAAITLGSIVVGWVIAIIFEYPHRYRHLGSAGACRVGIACNCDASAISDSGISVGQFVRFSFPFKATLSFSLSSELD
jgi:hypothetical protein